ncbi:MAG: DinB family protein [Methanoregulaceae archaeon]|nr:DinB family protein [Methanoregulaceae archaeon]
MVALFAEVFEGQPKGIPTWILEREDGLLQLLEGLSAEAASRQVAPGLNSCAAHAYHVNYILSLTNGFIRGENPTPDWESSWSRQAFEESEWKDLRDSIRREYAGVLAFLSSNPEWPSEDWLKGAMALIPHMAYHAGSIRQLARMVDS